MEDETVDMTSRRGLTSANVNSCNLKSDLVSMGDIKSDHAMKSEVEEAVDARF